MYQAIICKIVNIKDHPNADRLNVGVASGHQVIVSKEVEEGTLGIFFPTDGQLSEDMCKKNNLYRHTFLNEDPEAKAGFFEDNRRVKAVTLRKAKSEGFWSELNILEWTEANLEELKPGQLLDELNGKPICNKYFTKATRTARAAGQGKTSKKSLLKASFPDFKEHWSTSKLRMMIQFIPEGAILSITEKCHGTSGRTGYLKQEHKLGFVKSLWNKLFPAKFKTSEYKHVSGTRRVVIDPDVPDEGFYEGSDFRNMIHKQIAEAGLQKGETVYYEIVGYNDQGAAIMGSHKLEDKKLRKLYGDEMIYSYGCELPHLDEALLGKEPWKVLVYRITHTLEDGTRYEVPFHQLTVRCKELGLEYVPQLKEPYVYDGKPEGLMETCELLSQGSSTLDAGHIKEGVVVRIEAPGMDTNCKYKGWNFCLLENICKNTDTYVDLEEIA